MPTYDPVTSLRDYADAVTASNHPDAPAWAEALRWAASRIRGGHGSLHAHREFRQQFGMVAEHCGAGPWDGSELARAVDHAIPPAIDRALDRDHSLCGAEPCSDCR